MKQKKIEAIEDDETIVEDGQEGLEESTQEDSDENLEAEEVTPKKKSKKKMAEENESVNADDEQESGDEESLEEKIKKKKQKEIDQYDFEFVKEEKKIFVDHNITEIKNIDVDKRVIGTRQVMRYLRQKKIAKIFITVNHPEYLVQEIDHIAKIDNVTIVKIQNTNAELGVVCRKPFDISLLGVLK